MTIKLLVTLGTYEKSLYGVDFKLNDDNKISVQEKKNSFAIPAHTGCIKAVTSVPKFLVSGSTDETVRIFDLRRRKDYGSLTCHSGSVSCLAFYKQTMLFTAGEDGKIYVTRCADWETLLTLRGHSGGVTALAVHPSGKLALSVGKDRCVKTWNLVTGKIALKTRMDRPIDRIIWSPSGSYYVFLSERRIVIHQTDGAVNVLDYEPPSKLFAAAFTTKAKIAFVGEGSLIHSYDIEKKKWTVQETSHKPRIKDIVRLEHDGHVFVATGSSDGLMCLWIVAKDGLHLLESHSSNLRITCLTITSQ